MLRIRLSASYALHRRLLHGISIMSQSKALRPHYAMSLFHSHGGPLLQRRRGSSTGSQPPDNGDNGDESGGKGGKGKKEVESKKQDKEEAGIDKGVVRGRPVSKKQPANASNAVLKVSQGESSDKMDRIKIPEQYPQLLAVPLTRRPLFPGFYKSLHIKDPQVIKAIQSLVERRQPYIGVFLAKDDKADSDVVSDTSQINTMGVFCQITNTYQTGPDNASLTVVVYPHRRIRISSLVQPGSEDASGFLPINAPLLEHQVPLANVDNLSDEPYDQDNRLIKAITSEIINVLKEISQLNPLLRDQIISISVQTGNLLLDPSKLADFAAAVSSGSPSELQGVLESLVVEERLHKALVILKKELANAKLQQEISKEVDKKMTRKQQEYFLMEQLKGIKKELGMESDGKEKLVEKFKEKAKKLKMPETIKRVFEEVFYYLSYYI